MAPCYEIHLRPTASHVLRLAGNRCTPALRPFSVSPVMVSSEPPLCPPLSLSKKSQPYETSIAPFPKKMPMKLYGLSGDNEEEKEIINEEKNKKVKQELNKEEWRKLKWAFIKQMYGGFLAIQLPMTALAYSAAVVSLRYKEFFIQNPFLLAATLLLPCVLSIPIGLYKKKDGFLIMLFSMLVGTSCFHFSSRLMVQSAIVTAAVVAAITWYSFWAKDQEGIPRFELIAYLGLNFIETNISLFQQFYPGAPISPAVSKLLGFMIDSSVISWLTIAYLKQTVCTNEHQDNNLYLSVLLQMAIFSLFHTTGDYLSIIKL